MPLPSSFSWHSEPREWSVDPVSNALRLRTLQHTDFWQRTHYGFERDNGHFFFTPISFDFVMSARIRFSPVHQYDQAGLMVRVGPECWIKTSVEFEPGRMSRMGAVVTPAGYSDWSTQDVPADTTDYRLRISREGDTYTVAASIDRLEWMQIRMAYLPTKPGAIVQCGMYACSPGEGGMQASFDEFAINRAADACEDV
jgi:regulation of enolase protein 1 (concanavalin A-like superfamily)